VGELSWRTHPFLENAPRSYGAAAFLVALALLVNCAFGGWLWSALAVLFLFGSLARYFLPSEYRLTAEGVEVRFLGRLRRYPWGRFRNLYPHGVGLHLSPFERPSGLDPFRGLFLRYARGMGPEVEAFCRARIRHPAAS